MYVVKFTWMALRINYCVITENQQKYCETVKINNSSEHFSHEQDNFQLT